MLDLTFAEQVKIILSRRGMTIKELAQIIEERTGKKMSRQNLTQRLGRDNFQEQDMRMIAEILECPFHLSILGEARQEAAEETQAAEATSEEVRKIAERKERKQKKAAEREVTIGELVDMAEPAGEPEVPEPVEFSETAEPEEESAADEMPVEIPEEPSAEEAIPAYEESTEEEEVPEEQPKEEAAPQEEKQEKKTRGSWLDFFQRRQKKEPVKKEVREEIEEPEVTENGDSYPETVSESTEEPEWAEDAESTEEIISEETEDLEKGEINPYTGHEYESNTVREHPKRIGYVQVYNRADHQWTDMTEWAFLGYQEQKKAMLGKDYEPPIYLD